MASSINYDINANTSGAMAAVGKFQSSLGSIATVAAGILAPIAAAFSVKAFAGGIKGALDLGGRLSDLSARTGESAGTLAILEQAFTDAGLGASRVGPAINLMQRALGGLNDMGQPTATAFDRLGISIESLKGQAASDQLTAISKGMASITDPAERTAVAMQIFGRSGGEMLALLGDSSAMESAAQTVGGQADILARNASLFDRVSDLLAITGQKVSGFFVGVADKVAPILLPLLEGFNAIDLSGLGQKIGDIIAFLVTAFSSGQIGDIIGSSLIISFQNAVNFLWAALQGLGAALGQFFVEAAHTLADSLAILTTADFWAGIGQALQSAALSFSAYLLDAVNGIQGGFMKILRFFGADKMADSMEKSLADRQAAATDLHTAAADKSAAATDTLSPFFDTMATRFQDGLANIATAYQDTVANAPPVFDTSTQQSVLDSAIASVFDSMEQTRQAAEAATAAIPKSTSETSPLEKATATAATRPNADRLAQIGGYVGGMGRADRTAEDTAKATRDTAKNTERIARAISTPPQKGELTF